MKKLDIAKRSLKHLYWITFGGWRTFGKWAYVNDWQSSRFPFPSHVWFLLCLWIRDLAFDLQFPIISSFKGEDITIQIPVKDIIKRAIKISITRFELRLKTQLKSQLHRCKTKLKSQIFGKWKQPQLILCWRARKRNKTSNGEPLLKTTRSDSFFRDLKGRWWNLIRWRLRLWFDFEMALVQIFRILISQKERKESEEEEPMSYASFIHDVDLSLHTEIRT